MSREMSREVFVNVTEARSKLPDVIRQSEEHPVILIRNSRPEAVVFSYRRYEDLLDRLEDMEDRLAVFESMQEEDHRKIPYDKVRSELGLMAENS